MSIYGFGVSPWGTGQWGDAEPEAIPGGLGYGRAYAVGDRVVRVELSHEPLHIVSTGVGDALNPRTWKIRNLVTGQQWTLMAVREVSVKVYEILTFEVLPKHYTELELSTGTLVDADRVPLPSLEFLFNGCYLSDNNTAQQQAAAGGYLQQDLQNQIVPQLGAASGGPTVGAAEQYGEMVSGTLLLDSGGDYVNQYGTDLIKKLILRRMIAKPGDFFHLPTYGMGLRVKEPLPVNDLRKLAAAIEAQVKLEPEVQACKANLSYSASAAVLNVVLKVQLEPNGQTMQIPLVVPTGAVQL